MISKSLHTHCIIKNLTIAQSLTQLNSNSLPGVSDGAKMTVNGRRELFEALKPVYLAATWVEKGRLLDGFVAGTGYSRKHAIVLLNGEQKEPQPRLRKPKYGAVVVQALITLWKAANRICPQGLIPFPPSLIESLERFGHLHLDTETKELLLCLSPATMDRLLKQERKKYANERTQPDQDIY